VKPIVSFISPLLLSFSHLEERSTEDPWREREGRGEKKKGEGEGKKG